MSARDAMLAAIRTALGPPRDVSEPPRRYRPAGGVPAGSAELVDLLCERLADYGATVHRAATPAELERAIAAACDGERVLRAPGVDWAAEADSAELPPADLDTVDAALTGCALAIAATGTIVLDGGPTSGRRALTLVPDHHVCVVRTEQVVSDVPDAVEALGEAARAGRPITLISGPSATSDIELERVEGVHGPRRLDVIVVG
jgi:L-lactate dehydrogenase complex protein LldG